MPNYAKNKGGKQFFVTGIGTDVGKTIVSAILVKALEASYWKPVQSGSINGTDSERIKALVPDAIILDATDLKVPDVDGNLIVEGAGGLLVPVNDEAITYLDLAKLWDIPAIVVSRHYLGSINHTLLTLEVLRTNNIAIEGLIYVGDRNEATEQIISKYSNVKVLARIPETTNLNAAFISEQAEVLKAVL